MSVFTTVVFCAVVGIATVVLLHYSFMTMTMTMTKEETWDPPV